MYEITKFSLIHKLGTNLKDNYVLICETGGSKLVSKNFSKKYEIKIKWKDKNENNIF